MNQIANESHTCTVEKQTSGSFLPPLPKEANCFQRFIRKYKKFTQVSEKDPLTQEYFRSTTGFLNERKRHAQSRYSYIIHPFSDFGFCREIILIIAYFSTYICAPLVATFTAYGICDLPWIYLLELLTTIIFLLDIVVRFFMGIDDRETKQVVLDHKKIVRKYTLNIYFIMDILTAFSFCTVNHIVDASKYHFLTTFRLLKVLSLLSFLRYWTHVAQRWNFSSMWTELLRYMIMTFILIHWSTCLVYYVSSKHLDDIGKTFIHLFNRNIIPAIYFETLFTTMGILFCARGDWRNDCSQSEVIMMIALFIIGRIYMLIVTVSTLNEVLNQWSLETKYLAIVDQLKEFMRYKKLPMNLRQRMLHYFEYKFQHKYFRENLITSILSDKLKREVNIEVCRRLVQQASFLADLPTKVLGNVLTHLKSEVFLPNDVIIRAGAQGDCMYFLSSGTVLISTPSGKEVCHLQDGAYFGEIALLSKETKRTANVVALEICETYRLDKKVFKMSIKKYPECVKVIQALAEIRHQETNALEDLHKEELFHKTYIGENETLEGSLRLPKRYHSSHSSI